MEEVARNQANSKVKNKKDKDTVKRKKIKEGKIFNTDKQISEILHKEMKNLNQNLNKMETKFVRKIEVLEQKQKKIHALSNKRKSIKRKPKKSIKNTNSSRLHNQKNLYLSNPVDITLKKPDLTPKMVSMTPMMANNLYFEDRILKHVMDKLEDIVQTKVQEQCTIDSNKYELKVNKTIKNLEK